MSATKVRRRKRGNKAEQIRQAFGELGVEAMPKEVCDHLAKKNVKVSPTQVSGIRSRLHANGNGNGHASRFDDLLLARAAVGRFKSPAIAKRAIADYFRLLG
jgi:hypothetical protein